MSDSNAKYKFGPKKKFGQNFLVNTAMQQKIAQRMKDLVDNYPSYNILEIGPGQGDLTQHFLQFNRKILAIEIDQQAVNFLTENFANETNLTIMLADALNFIEGHNSTNDKFILLSNLPFNVGSRILVDLPIYNPNMPIAVILQKEVVEKIKVNKDFTFFGAWLNLFWELKVEFDIGANNFLPCPKVCSSLLTGVPKTLPVWLEIESKRLHAKNLLKTLFRQPRKTIENNLKNTEFDSLTCKVSSSERLNWQNYQQILEQLHT